MSRLPSHVNRSALVARARRPGARALAVSALISLPWTEPALAGEFRLGAAAHPTFQRIELVLDPRDDTYTGTTRIEITLAGEVDTLELHAERMTIERAALTGPGGTRELDPAAFTRGHMGHLAMPLGATREPGDYLLEMAFTQSFDRQAVGLYKLEADGGAYAFTQLEATDARKAFPCFDEPAFKARFELHLDVPESDRAFANTPVVEEHVSQGRRRYAFAPTPKISSYLVAMAVGPLEAVPIEGLRVPGNVIVPAGKTALTAEAARVTPSILEALEAYFGTEYPFAKLDLVAVPEFWPGAMENAGLITFREDALLLDERATVGQRRYLVEVLAHEIAHQWFGNLVTMAWWDDLWLNESFATWMENKIGVELFPEYGFEIDRIESAQFAMATDTQTASRAIRQPVESLASLLQSADILAYEKGQAVLHMFEQWMGPEAFKAGVRDYFARHLWGNATAADLFASLSSASGIDVGAAMATFLDQPGVPIVHAEYTGGGRVKLTQRRFLNYGAELEGAAADARWMIPVRIRFRDADGVRTENVFLTAETETFDIGVRGELAWLHPNAGEGGYYRWGLPPGELLSLAEDADQALSAGEGVGLVSTLGALLASGALHSDELLRVLELIAADAKPEVLDAITSELDTVHLVFITEELEEPFAAYCRRVLRPALATLGYAETPGEPQAVTLLRPRVLSRLVRYGKDEEVVAWGKAQAIAYLADREAVDPSLAGIVLDIAAYDGDRALWDTYRERFETASIPAQRSRFLSSLGSFRDTALADATLEYAFDDDVRPQELGSILRSVRRELPRNSPRVFEWTKKNYDAVAARIPPPYLVYMPYSAMSCSDEMLADALSFYSDPAHAPPGTEAELAKVAEAVRDCVGLHAREGERMKSYLERLAQKLDE